MASSRDLSPTVTVLGRGVICSGSVSTLSGVAIGVHGSALRGQMGNPRRYYNIIIINIFVCMCLIGVALPQTMIIITSLALQHFTLWDSSGEDQQPCMGRATLVDFALFGGVDGGYP